MIKEGGGEERAGSFDNYRVSRRGLSYVKKIENETEKKAKDRGN